MTTQLTKNRKFVNGTSDLRGIGKRDLETPLTIDGDQFVTGNKTFVAPTRFYSDVSSGGFYYGDGSKLVNLPIINDPSKLPLAGGTMTGPIVMSLDPVPGVVNTLTNEHVEIVGTGTELAALGFASGETTNPKVFLSTSSDKTCIVTGNAVSLLDTGMLSEMRLDIYGCQKTGSGNDFIIRNEEPLGIGAQKQFLRLQCGQSYKSDPSLNPDTGEHWIEKDEHVKVFDDKNGWDANKAFHFHNAFDYLNQDAKGGFSVLLSNCSSSPCRVEPNDDGTLFYCKDIGGEQPEFWLHQWDTTRVTLVILSDGTYRWAVSMYR